jgi:hypothetical protein
MKIIIKEEISASSNKKRRNKNQNLLFIFQLKTIINRVKLARRLILSNWTKYKKRIPFRLLVLYNFQIKLNKLKYYINC